MKIIICLLLFLNFGFALAQETADLAMTEQEAMKAEVEKLPVIFENSKNLLEKIQGYSVDSCGYNYVHSEGMSSYYYNQSINYYIGEPPAKSKDGKRNCGYAFPFKRRYIKPLCKAIHAFVNGEEDDLTDDIRCHVSNCTTASYIAIVRLLRTRRDWNELKDHFDCKDNNRGSFFGDAYHLLIGLDGLKNMVRTLNLGEVKDIYPNKMLEELEKGWPIPGDPVLINRTKKYDYSGHLVIFDHYEFDDKGNITNFCYWSSNYPRGTSKRCEPIYKFQVLHAARISQKEFLYEKIEKAEPKPINLQQLLEVKLPEAKVNIIPVGYDYPAEEVETKSKKKKKSKKRKKK